MISFIKVISLSALAYFTFVFMAAYEKAYTPPFVLEYIAVGLGVLLIAIGIWL